MLNFKFTILILIVSTVVASVIEEDIANVGTRFILASVRYNSMPDEKLRIFLYNPNATKSAAVSAEHSLKISISGDQWTIGPKSSTYIDVPMEYGMNKSSQQLGKGFQLTSTIPIKVRMINEASSMTDPILVFPYEELGEQYYVITPCHGDQTYRQVHVVSGDANTYVEIVLAGNQSTPVLKFNSHVYYGGQSIQVIMDQHDVLQLASFSDLTGTKIMASNPVSVFSGCDYDSIAASQSANSSDFYHHTEQVIDMGRLGRHFDFYRMQESEIVITASQDHTYIMIYINGVCKNIELEAGDTMMDSVKMNSLVTIDSNHPLLGATGSDVSAYRYETPREQAVSKTVLCADFSGMVRYYLVVNSNCTSDFLVDNIPLDVRYFVSECFNFNNNSERCVLLSPLFDIQSGCYLIENSCGVFSGRLILVSGNEEMAGNDMKLIAPTCAGVNSYSNKQCINDTAYVCNSQETKGTTSISTTTPITKATTASTSKETTTSTSKSTTVSTNQSTSTSTTQATPSAPATNTTGAPCKCDCQYYGPKNIKERILDEIEQMKKELQVDKTTLSSTIRGHISAPDPRPSARAVGGTVGVVCMTCVFGGIILFDLPLYLNLLKYAAKLLKAK